MSAQADVSEAWNADRILGLFQTRIRFIGPYLVSAAILWAAHGRLQPALQESQRLNTRLGGLLGQLENAERARREAEDVHLESRHAALLQSLAPDPEKVREWINAISSFAGEEGWSLQCDPGEAEPLTAGGGTLLRIPLRFTLRPESPQSTTSSRFHQLLKLGERILQTPYRLDLSAISVSATDRGISEAVLDLNLWTQPPTP